MSAGGLLFLLAFGLTAAEASAAVVVGERVQRPAEPGTVPALLIEFAAAPGEPNSLEVEADPTARAWRLSDAGATLDATGDCRPLSPHEVVCALPPGARVAELRVSLGDGNDRARAPARPALPATGYFHGGDGDDVVTTGAQFTLSGEAGNDALTAMSLRGGPGDDDLTVAAGDGHVDAGPGDDLVTGGPQDDWLEGGGGIDALLGGDGDDRIGDGDDDVLAVDRDRLDGGPGHDLVSWDSHPVAIDVDLAATGPGVSPRARMTSAASRRPRAGSATTACAAATARTS